MPRIIALESDDGKREMLREALCDFPGFTLCRERTDFLGQIKANHFDLILLALHEDNEEACFELIRRAKAAMPFSPLIVLSDTEEVQTVVQAMKFGASEFVTKPFSPLKVLLLAEKALENKSLQQERDYLRHEQDVIYDFDRIIAFSPAMRRVMENIRKYAVSEATVLMRGETGTGKSMLAGAIHFNSPRRAKPFIKINCANIQENLLESELFGHEKGAFTGADRLRIGRFEQGTGGTVFLDEIGEMTPALQAKLLRVLEEKSFERVGGNQTIRVNVRIIAATNRSLEDLIIQGKFREDLYYRINVLPMHLPPLRERRECIEPLSYHLLWKMARSLHKNITTFSPAVLLGILDYPWPGNIRQLANTIERAVILEERECIMPENFLLASPPRPDSARMPLPAGEGAMLLPGKSTAPEEGEGAPCRGERDRICRALEQSLWIQKDAAKLLGLSPRMLNHRIKRLGITHSRWRKNV